MTYLLSYSFLLLDFVSYAGLFRWQLASALKSRRTILKCGTNKKVIFSGYNFFMRLCASRLVFISIQTWLVVPALNMDKDRKMWKSQSFVAIYVANKTFAATKINENAVQAVSYIPFWYLTLNFHFCISKTFKYSDGTWAIQTLFYIRYETILIQNV